MIKVMFDIDGVLADFTQGFAKLANKLYPGVFPVDYRSLVDQETWNFEECSNLNITKKQVSAVWKELRHNKKSFWSELPANRMECEQLSQFLLNRPIPSVDVYFITSRVPSAGASVLYQSTSWLIEQGCWDNGCTVIVKPKGVSKQEIYRLLKINFSVDDHWDNVPYPNEISGHRGFLLERVWNRNHRDELLTVPTFKQYLNIINDYWGIENYLFNRI